MEATNTDRDVRQEKIRELWRKAVLDWGIVAHLPLGLELADGKSVDSLYDTGFSEYGNNSILKTSKGFGDVKGHHFYLLRPDSRVVTITELADGNACFLYYPNLFLRDLDYRQDYAPATIGLKMTEKNAHVLLNNLRKSPSFIDAVVSAKFPELVKNRKFEPWKELVYLPQDVTERDFEEKMEVLHRS